MVAPGPDDTDDTPRRRGRLLSAGVSLLMVGVGGWFALRRRRPQLPAFAEEARPSPAPREAPRPVPTTSPGPETTAPAPVVAPQTTAPAPAAAAETTAPTPPPGPAAGEELLRVSGIGRRSADALAAAGIGTLRRLADSDDASLVAALEAAGLRRSPTLSSWAAQARRLADG